MGKEARRSTSRPSNSLRSGVNLVPDRVKEFAMGTCRQLALAVLTASAALVCLGARADAAQCGNGPGGFEAWKQQFAEEAKAKGIGGSAIAGLMQTHYASAT